jgi:amino acid transporter
MEGFESVGKSAEEAEAGFAHHHFFLAISLAILVGILFYVMVIAAVAVAAPRESFLHTSFATAVALEKAVGSRWVVNLVMAAGLLSVVKCFNGNMVAASRLFFALGRRGMVHAGLSHIHPLNRTPTVAVVWLGLATAVICFGGDSMLVPIAEVGSVAVAVGWMATCASWLRMKPSMGGMLAAGVGLIVTLAMVIMKMLPAIPGHFTIYEWIAVAIWSVIGLALHRGKGLTTGQTRV